MPLQRDETTIFYDDFFPEWFVPRHFECSSTLTFMLSTVNFDLETFKYVLLFIIIICQFRHLTFVESNVCFFLVQSRVSCCIKGIDR
jgi:hypothetical protein